MARIYVVNKGIVDGRKWYTIICDQEVARCLYKLEETSYRFVAATSTGNLFDIPENTYIVLKLVWSD
jgi:hypothetical protein